MTSHRANLVIWAHALLVIWAHALLVIWAHALLVIWAHALQNGGGERTDTPLAD